MKSITNLKRGLLQLALVWLCSLSASAQVPSTMDYQIMATNPKTGQVLANKELTVKVELRLNSEEGESVWSKEETLTSSKSGICTISLDFANVDWTLGCYYIKAFVNGEPIGTSQVKSVPFALMADGVSGVITKQNLIGTWGGSRIDDKDKAIHYTFVLEANGKFVYTCKGYETEVYTGTWKINNLGFITFNITSGPYLHGKYVLFSVYDKEDNSLYLGGNDDFLGDGLTLTKQK